MAGMFLACSAVMVRISTKSSAWQRHSCRRFVFFRSPTARRPVPHYFSNLGSLYYLLEPSRGDVGELENWPLTTLATPASFCTFYYSTCLQFGPPLDSLALSRAGHASGRFAMRGNLSTAFVLSAQTGSRKCAPLNVRPKASTDFVLSC